MDDAEKARKIAPFLNGAGKTNRAYVKDAEMGILVPSNGQKAQMLEGKYTFKDMVGRLYEDVNTLQHDSETKIQELVAGETDNIHEVTRTMDEAETAFELMMKIHQKLIEAYDKLQAL